LGAPCGDLALEAGLGKGIAVFLEGGPVVLMLDDVVKLLSSDV
jgi:hypothetical protein